MRTQDLGTSCGAQPRKLTGLANGDADSATIRESSTSLWWPGRVDDGYTRLLSNRTSIRPIVARLTGSEQMLIQPVSARALHDVRGPL